MPPVDCNRRPRFADKLKGLWLVETMRGYVVVAVRAVFQRLEGIEGKIGSRDRLGEFRCARLDPPAMRRQDDVTRAAVLNADAIVDSAPLIGGKFLKGSIAIGHLRTRPIYPRRLG